MHNATACSGKPCAHSPASFLQVLPPCPIADAAAAAAAYRLIGRLFGGVGRLVGRGVGRGGGSYDAPERAEAAGECAEGGAAQVRQGFRGRVPRVPDSAPNGAQGRNGEAPQLASHRGGGPPSRALERREQHGELQEAQGSVLPTPRVQLVEEPARLGKRASTRGGGGKVTPKRQKQLSQQGTSMDKCGPCAERAVSMSGSCFGGIYFV